jgi:opacity protein-like surface antigen
MKKLLIIAIALMASVTFSNAQVSNHFGVRAGVNFSKLSTKSDGESNTSDNKTGFNVGVVDQINFSKSVPLFIETGLMCNLKGGKESATGTLTGVKGKVNISEYYLEVPALLGYNIGLNDGFAIQPFAGLYYGLGIGGKSKATIAGVSEETDTFSDDNLKRSDFGFRVGAGVVYSNFYLGAGFERSLINIARDDDKVKNQTFTISLGYNF